MTTCVNQFVIVHTIMMRSAAVTDRPHPSALSRTHAPTGSPPTSPPSPPAGLRAVSLYAVAYTRRRLHPVAESQCRRTHRARRRHHLPWSPRQSHPLCLRRLRPLRSCGKEQPAPPCNTRHANSIGVTAPTQAIGKIRHRSDNLMNDDADSWDRASGHLGSTRSGPSWPTTPPASGNSVPPPSSAARR
jgi:hypothetical protein